MAMNSSDQNLIEIDQNRLDEEWVKQPNLYYDYAVKLAEAKFKLAETKAQVDVVRAELSFKMRNDPGKYAILKLTEGSLQERVQMHARMIEITSQYNQAKLEVDMLSAAVEALDHRKKALESLVYLHGANYFSEPRVKGEAKSAMDEVAKKKIRSTTMPDPRKK